MLGVNDILDGVGHDLNLYLRVREDQLEIIEHLIESYQQIDAFLIQ
jgi:hypothetical protein